MTKDEAKALLVATAINLGSTMTVVEGSHAKDEDLAAGIGAPAEGVECEIIGFVDGIAKDDKGTERSFLVVDLLGKDGAPYRVNLNRLTKNKSLAAKYGFIGKFGAVKTAINGLIGKSFRASRIVTQFNETLGYNQVTQFEYTIG